MKASEFPHPMFSICRDQICGPVRLPPLGLPNFHPAKPHYEAGRESEVACLISEKGFCTRQMQKCMQEK